MTRADLARSSGQLLSDALARASGLGILGSGCHGAWDLPFTLSPGTERLSLSFDGLPIAGPAVPEAALALLSPLALERLFLLAPDPLLDPLGSGRDGILWGEPIDLGGGGSRSAVRFTEGPSGAATEDLVIGRQSSRGQWWGSYAHSRSEGRPIWIHPRYSLTGFQNLGVHVDRASRVGPVRLDASDRVGRYQLAGNGKLEWGAQYLSGGWQLTPDDSLSGELRLTRRNDRLHGWGDGGQTFRRTTSTEVVARASLQRRRIRLSVAAGAERVSLRYQEQDRYEQRRSSTGLGLAIAGTWKGDRAVVHATAGWVRPWWGEGYGRVHLLGSVPLGVGLGAEVEGWSQADAPFVPRLEGDETALLEDGVVLPGGVTTRDRPERRVTHAEARLRAGRGGPRASIGLFARRLEEAIGVDPSLHAALDPGDRDAKGFAALAGNATLVGVRGACRVGLPLGARVEGDATLLLDPGPDRLPVLTARERGRGVLAIGHDFFRGDLRLEARLVAQGRGRWSTPYGPSPGSLRWDAEIHGAKGAARFFFALRHLTNETQDSGTYADGEWMPQPYRSSQIGVEWHFFN